jgi:hypothetical protein
MRFTGGEREQGRTHTSDAFFDRKEFQDFRVTQNQGFHSVSVSLSTELFITHHGQGSK